MTVLRRASRRLGGVLVLLAALGAASILGACGSGSDRTASVSAVDPTGTADFAYVIPLGTGERIDRGEPVDIIPANIDARVGQVLRIVNEDTRGHLVGPFFVGKGETLTQRFASPGTLEGACSIHPSGTITVTVRK